MQNNTQHTPGPWIVRSPEETHGCGHVISGNGESIAQTTGRGWTSDEPRAKRNVANARLIASAPELLFWLKDLCNGIEEEFASSEAICIRAKEAREAIAKATGFDQLGADLHNNGVCNPKECEFCAAIAKATGNK